MPHRGSRHLTCFPQLAGRGCDFSSKLTCACVRMCVNRERESESESEERARARERETDRERERERYTH